MDPKVIKLVEEMKAGNEEAFNEFFRLVEDRVLGFSMKFCGNRDDARDIVQQTLLQAYQTLPNLKFNDIRPLRVWLYRVARNYCLMMRRKERRRPEEELSAGFPAGDESRAMQLADWSNLPEEQVSRKELGEIVQRATLELAPTYRIVLILRDMEELSTREVAEVLDISEENVKIRLHRARQFVRRKLSEQLDAGKGSGVPTSGHRLDYPGHSCHLQTAPAVTSHQVNKGESSR